MKVLAIAAAMLGSAAAFVDLRPTADPIRLAAEVDTERDHISALDLAERIMRGDAGLQVFDLRSAAEFDNVHIPTARQISIVELVKQALPLQATIVLYSEGGAHAAQAWVLLRMRGYRNVYFLREGLYEWLSRVLEPRLAIDATAAERAQFARAAELSRFFGGDPRSDVPRAQVPTGYWTNAPAVTRATVRKRGC